MKIEITTNLNLGNTGIDELIKLVEKKGKLFFDFTKGKIILEDIPASQTTSILKILKNHFEISHMEINNEKKFKIRNDEKELQQKKENMLQEIAKKPYTKSSQVKDYILKEKVFTLTQLRETFPEINFATLRSYVKELKKENIIVDLERGKYSIR